MKELLIVNNLTKTFHLSRKQRALEKTDVKVKVAVDDLSFKVYEGEIYGLLGPNGAGKTTTLRIISTLIKADDGDALVDGASVAAGLVVAVFFFVFFFVDLLLLEESL